MEVIYPLQEIDQIAAQILTLAGNGNVIALKGEMGAGKTTLIKAICRQLGVTDFVSSPTFSLINQYQTINGNTVFHLDLYRIKEEEEAINAGMEDCLYSSHLCLVEWPEKIASLLPDDTLYFNIVMINESLRKLVSNQNEK